MPIWEPRNGPKISPSPSRRASSRNPRNGTTFIPSNGYRCFQRSAAARGLLLNKTTTQPPPSPNKSRGERSLAPLSRRRCSSSDRWSSCLMQGEAGLDRWRGEDFSSSFPLVLILEEVAASSSTRIGAVDLVWLLRPTAFLLSWLVGIRRCCGMPGSFRSPSTDAAGDIESALDDFARADADCIAAALACGRNSFSYRRLPEPRLLRLTVRKLDDSYFDVQIARSAAVWELKAAIEDVFAALYDDADKAISWQHVWSHFCLCFKDEKLTDDKATLRAFGIRDGDELHFAQHLSVEYRPCKSLSLRRSRTSLDDFSARSRNLLDDLGEDDGDKFIDTRHSTSVLEEGLYVYQYDEVRMEEGRKKGGFFSGWFSYSRLRDNSRTHSEDAIQASCQKRDTRTRPKLGKWLSSKNTKGT
uniref:SNRNP25 ubiquitin-like domain-containing protein n=1 Tax=Oryza punctata TaxID=4537 RepID=A0A0E0JWK5_ORYPU